MADKFVCEQVEVTKVIRFIGTKGSGLTADDPVRKVEQYWDFEDNMIAEMDKCAKEKKPIN